MNTLLKFKFGLFALTLLVLVSCQKEEFANSEINSYTKPLDKTQIGDGNVSLWLQSDKEGKPEVLGLTFSKKALDNPPQSDDHMANEFVLDLSKAKVNLPFDHVGLNWNPQWHEPDPIYTLPHFDFHYYMISPEERMSIGLNDPKIDVVPDAQYLPAGYITTPGGVPMMGKHWIDPTSPELNGETFTRTFIYGSYDGNVTFMEPMITRDFIQSKPNARYEIKQPATYEKAGYYPLQYGVYYNSRKGEYSVTLENFVWREGSAN